MKKFMAKKFIVTLIIATLMPALAEARTQATVNEGQFKPIPIAIAGFSPGDVNGQRVDTVLQNVIANDLGGSGLFELINKAAFVETLKPGQIKPNFPNWSQIGAQALLTGSVRSNGSTTEVEFRLWDVLSGQQIAGMAYTTSERGLRRVAHQIADKVYESLTGEGGYFDSRIVYVAESGPKNRRVKQLAIMDQDGANHQFITGGKTLVLTPRFSPRDQKIIYLSYSYGNPRVRTLEIETGHENVVGDFPGMTFAPRYNSDGSKLVLSMSLNGGTDIYELDTRSGHKTRLTSGGGAINTTPFYSPDNSQIVFSSDRGGSQALYIMNADGSNVHRITYGKGNYATPVWSPRGDYIAFTKQDGSFHIGVIKADGTGERLLTSSFLDEGPSWAPNGRVIVFSRGEPSGRSRLHSIDITGYNDHVIPTPGDASDSTWSPLLK